MSRASHDSRRLVLCHRQVPDGLIGPAGWGGDPGPLKATAAKKNSTHISHAAIEAVVSGKRHLPVPCQQVPEELVGPAGWLGDPRPLKATAAANRQQEYQSCSNRGNCIR
jgi:hypothetical protein